MTQSSRKTAGRRASDAEPAQEPDKQKGPEAILEEQVEQADIELVRSTGGLLLSGLAAGLEIGFGPALMALIFTLTDGVYSHPTQEMLMASAYSVGFVIVIIGRSELFTEHTALAVQPVLSGSASLRDLLRLWGLVYLSNLVGATLFAIFLAWSGPALGNIDPRAFTHMARPLVEHPWWAVGVGGIFAGWLMGLLAWLVNAAQDTLARIVLIWMITVGIGLAHLQHSIAGSIEVLTGVFGGTGIGWGDFAHFLLWSTLGNAAGGVVFVALIKYGHASRGGPQQGRPR